MGRFNRKRLGSLPEVSTASLPDIVFMLLFFFMVTTVMREDKQLVKTELPDASHLQRLENRTLISYVRIGPPFDMRMGTAPCIQLGDDFARLQDIGQFIELERTPTPEPLRNKRTTSLKVDAEAQMGIVTDVKQELRNANALKLLYAADDVAAIE